MLQQDNPTPTSEPGGSVRTRADCNVSFFCAAHDEAITMRALKEAAATRGSAEMGFGMHEVPELIVTSAEAGCRAYGTEATRRSISAVDSPMILLNPVVEILAVPVSDIGAKLASDRTRVTVMPVRGHASDRFGRSKEVEEPPCGRVVQQLADVPPGARSID